MLSDAQVKALKPKESRYSVADGEGVNVSVFPSGKKKWVLSYRKNGKQYQKTLGEAIVPTVLNTVPKPAPTSLSVTPFSDDANIASAKLVSEGVNH